MSTISNLPLSQSLLLKGLSLPNKMAMVYSQDYGYNVLTQLTSKLASSISTPQSKVEISSLGNLGVYSKIVSNGTAAGSGMLLVPVSDASKFRVSDIVADGNLFQGIVVAVDTAANALTIAPHSVSSFTAGTHFLAGQHAKRFFDASANRSSTGKSTLNYTPDTDYALTSVTRESSHQSRRDRTASFVKWNGDFWWRSYDDLTLKAFAKQLEYKYAFSERQIKQGPLQTTDQQHFPTNVAPGSEKMMYRDPINPSLDGNTVEMGVEQMEFSENVMRYQTTLQFLNGRITGLMSAIRGE